MWFWTENLHSTYDEADKIGKTIDPAFTQKVEPIDPAFHMPIVDPEQLDPDVSFEDFSKNFTNSKEKVTERDPMSKTKLKDTTKKLWLSVVDHVDWPGELMMWRNYDIKDQSWKVIGTIHHEINQMENDQDFADQLDEQFASLVMKMYGISSKNTTEEWIMWASEYSLYQNSSLIGKISVAIYPWCSLEKSFLESIISGNINLEKNDINKKEINNPEKDYELIMNSWRNIITKLESMSRNWSKTISILDKSDWKWDRITFERSNDFNRNHVKAIVRDKSWNLSVGYSYNFNSDFYWSSIVVEKWFVVWNELKRKNIYDSKDWALSDSDYGDKWKEVAKKQLNQLLNAVNK